jgi:hypothetical protein
MRSPAAFRQGRLLSHNHLKEKHRWSGIVLSVNQVCTLCYNEAMLRSQHAQSAQVLPATPRQRVIAFLLASATALLTAAPSFYEALWPLAWVALVPLLVALRAASPKRALLLGWWAETLMYWVGFYWLIGTMVRFGFIAVPVSVCFFAIIGLGNSIRLGGAGSRGAGATEYPSGTTA